MAALIDLLSAGKRALWLDYADYAGKLLSGGKVPWLDATAFVAWQGKAQGLLRSDVVQLPLQRVIEPWLAAHPELAGAMGEKKRLLHALKTLLSDAALRAYLAELLAGLRGSLDKKPLVLLLPAPRSWIALASAQAGNAVAAAELSADDVDSASVYIADFLRAFGEIGVNGLLLEKGSGAPGDETESYQPILNVAANYRWDAGLLTAEGIDHPGESAGLGFVIAPGPVIGICSGLIVEPGFWDGVRPAPEAGPDRFLFARMPAGLAPEKALDLLAALRT